MKLILDLDGVLVDLFRGMCEAHELPYPEPYPKGEYDLQKAFGHTGTRSEFWQKVDGPEFWRDLNWLPDGRVILKICEGLIHRPNITIATKPVIDAGCYSGKYMWIERELPREYRRQNAVVIHKELFAAPDTILVDDSESNILAWQKRCFELCIPSHTVLCPRPWNSGTGDAARIVAKELGQITESVWLQES